MYRPRLEVAGLWDAAIEEKKEEKRQKGIGENDEIIHAFGKEKVTRLHSMYW